MTTNTAQTATIQQHINAAGGNDRAGSRTATVDFAAGDWVFITGRAGVWQIASVDSEAAHVRPAGQPDELDVVHVDGLGYHATMHAERTLPERQREALDNLRLLGAWPDSGWVVGDRATTRAALRRLVQRELAFEDRRSPGRFVAAPPQTDPPSFVGPLRKGLYACRHSASGGGEDGVYGECRLDRIGRAVPAGRAPMDELSKATMCQQISASMPDGEPDRLHLTVVRYSCSIPDCGCGSPPAAPAEERHLPGQPRPAADVLEEYNRARAAVRFKPDLSGPLQQFFFNMRYPPAEKLWRLRILLSCGCITERLAQEADTAPVKHRQEDPYTGEKLLPGQLVCDQHDDPEPYRTVLEYISWTELTFPVRIDDDLPTALRRGEPETKAWWKVRLCCGHVGTQVTDLSWRPSDGFPSSRDFDTPRKRAAAHRRIETARDLFGPDWVDHSHRMIDLGWPEPTPEVTCSSCPRARTIIAYQRVGLLAPPPKPPRGVVKKQPGKSALTRRLREIEAEAARLRAQLDELDEGRSKPARG